MYSYGLAHSLICCLLKSAIHVENFYHDTNITRNSVDRKKALCLWVVTKEKCTHIE